MSRVGKYPIILKDGVSASMVDGNIVVKGKKGELSFSIPSFINVSIEVDKILVSPKEKNIESVKYWGTVRACINNMVVGVSQGFTTELLITGVGYRASIKGKDLVLQLGFTNDVEFPIPEGVSIACPEPTRIVLTGIDKQKVTHTASKIRALKAPEPYKGKGIRYSNNPDASIQTEVVRRKEGKKK